MPAPLLSAALFVRNEEKHLPRCLESLVGWVDEIVVEDTGSTDSTVEIAKRYGAKVYHNPWRDDFGYHRTSVMERATGKFVLLPDADDECVDTDTRETRARLTEDRGLPDVFLVDLILRYPHDRTLSVLVPRLLRRAAGLRFINPIHEQLDVEAPAAASNIKLLHHGYAEPGALVAKERRNLRIAEAMQPRGVHALHCIVRSAFYLGQWRKAVACAYELLESCHNPALIEETCALGAAAAMNAKDTGAVAYLTSYGLGVSSQNPDLLMMQAVASLGKYAHGLRDGDSTARRTTIRPPVFWHDAAQVRHALHTVLGSTLGGDPKLGAPTAPSIEGPMKGDRE